MSLNPSITCPACGQPLPGRKGRICSKCEMPIKLHEKWQIVGSSVQHKDCDDPRQDKLAARLRAERTAQASLPDSISQLAPVGGGPAVVGSLAVGAEALVSADVPDVLGLDVDVAQRAGVAEGLGDEGAALGGSHLGHEESLSEVQR